MCTLVYKNCKEGDWVICNNCGKKMLLPYGADKCPECESEGTLSWAYGDDYSESDIDLLKVIGEEIEDTNKNIHPNEYLSFETLENEYKK